MVLSEGIVSGMSPDRTKRLVDSLTKGLLPPDIEALKTFFAQGLETTPELSSQHIRRPPVIRRRFRAGLIETKNVATGNSGEGLELLPTAITPRGKKLLETLHGQA
jgi:hypothetical protein